MSNNNLTLDDSSPDIIYSSNWAPQSFSNDLNTDKFFQSTYHSAQSSGATANISFTGSAVYLYGTQGPGHGNYAVQIDNSVGNLSAYAFATGYQQLLFSYQLDDGPHFLSVTAMTDAELPWFDLDYIMITVNSSDAGFSTASSSTSSTVSQTQTLTPPWMTEAALTTGSTSSPVATTSASSETSSTSNLSFILAVVFGALIAIGLLVALVVLILRWQRRGEPKGGDGSKGLGSVAGNRSLLSLGFGGVRGGGSLLFARNKRPSSPSFIGEPRSPYSPIGNNRYLALSPASRTDPFYRAPTPLEHQHHLDGRNSPFSALSHGTGTVLTFGSTTNLLSEKGRSPPAHITQFQHTDQPTRVHDQMHPVALEKPMPSHLQNRESSVAPNHGLFACDSRSMAGSGVGTLVPEYTAFGAPLEQLKELKEPEKYQEYPVDATYANPGVPTPSRAFPLSPLRPKNPPEATYYVDNNSSCKYNKAGKRKSQKPPRPRRPTGEGLLDWLGNGVIKGLERSASWKRRKDDANSSRTDFLKV